MRHAGGDTTARRTVLLAEDDSSAARALTRRLRLAGWEVVAVSAGERAIELVRARRFEALVLDMRLSGASGLDVLSVLDGLPTEPTVVLMSGYLDVQTTLAAVRMGADEVMEKPVDMERLLEVLRQSPSSPPSARVGELVGDSSAMASLRDQIRDVAGYPEVPVFIMGESGTGKELVARALHRLAGHPPSSLISINCAAIPEHLFESELFGHAAGAFSGARKAHTGLLAAAGSGTVLLDEVAEMPAALQAKLLRVLETRTFRRVGSTDFRPLQARIISATNRKLRGRKGESLRPDLFFRLAGVSLRTPPLRQRLEDVAPLARHFLEQLAERYPTSPTDLSPEALRALESHRWPGNVRELRAVLQSAVVRCSGPVLRVRHVAESLQARGCLDSVPPPPPESGTHPAAPGGLPELERSVILDAVEECAGNLSHAARKLRIPRSTLRDRLKKYAER